MSSAASAASLPVTACAKVSASLRSSASGRPAPSVVEKECSHENAAAAIVWKSCASRISRSSIRELSKARLPKVTMGTASAPLPAMVSRYLSRRFGSRPA